MVIDAFFDFGIVARAGRSRQRQFFKIWLIRIAAIFMLPKPAIISGEIKQIYLIA